MNIQTIYQEMQKELASIENFAASLKTSPGVKDVHPCIEQLDLLSGSTISVYIDIELENGCAVSWWTEINETEEGFIFSSSLRRNDENGDHIIEEYSDTPFTSDLQARKLLYASLMTAKVIAIYAEEYEKYFIPNSSRKNNGFIAFLLNAQSDSIVNANASECTQSISSSSYRNQRVKYACA